MPLGQRVAGSGNYLYINGQTPVIQGYTGVSNYSESPFGGSTITPSFEISPKGIFSDAMSTTIYSYRQLGSISSVGDLRSQNSFIGGTGNNNGPKNDLKQYQGALQVRYYHRRGLHNMIISGLFEGSKNETDSGGYFSSISYDAKIKVEVKNKNGSVVASKVIYHTTSAADGEINANIPLDGLAENTFYSIELYLKSTLSGDYSGSSVGDSARVDSTATIKNNLYITAVT